MQAEGLLSRNNVKTKGEGPPIVLVHGFGCDQTMWDPITPALTVDHEVILYDLTGMGESDYHEYDVIRHGSLDGHADDLIRILDEIERTDVVAVGHSVSAIIIGLAEIKRPDLFSKLIMIGPSPCYIDKPPYKGGFSKAEIEGLLETMDENYLGWAGQLASMVAGPENFDAVRVLDNRFCRNDPEISRHFAKVTFLSDNRDDLPKIKAPTLVIQSSRDSIAEPQVGEYVHSRLPNSELVVVDNTGHAPQMTDPKEVILAIRRFLEHDHNGD